MIQPAGQIPHRLLRLESHEGPDFSLPRDESAAARAFSAVSKLVMLMVRVQMEATRLSVPKAAVIAYARSDGSYGKFTGTDVSEGHTTYRALQVAIGKAESGGYGHLVAAAHWGRARTPDQPLLPSREDAAGFTVDGCADMFFVATDARFTNGLLVPRRVIASYGTDGVQPATGQFSVEQGLSIHDHQNALLGELGTQLARLYPDYGPGAHFVPPKIP